MSMLRVLSLGAGVQSTTLALIEEERMHAQAIFALAHPVYVPQRDMLPGHSWVAERAVTACLTVNIGEE